MALLKSDANAIATTVAALAGAWLINRWSQGYKTLASPLNVARFGLISFFPTAVISSGIAIAAPVLANALGFAEKRSTTLLLLLLMLGAGFLFADGMITPAISVLSAVEGLHVAPPTLGHTVIPITIGLLTVLFAVQFKGTSGIGIVFGSILVVWFAAIAVLGAWQIEQHPEVLAAFNPVYGLDFLRHAGLFDALLILGALMLVVTGSEAMYADVGHFGARPLRASWFAVVYPALVLNYLGQGAFLLTDTPVAGSRLLYSLVPHATLSDDSARHRCDDHRFAGANLRSLFACLASDPFGSISAPQATTHSPSVSRPDLYSLHQSIAFRRMHLACLDVRLKFSPSPGPFARGVRGNGNNFGGHVSNRAANRDGPCDTTPAEQEFLDPGGFASKQATTPKAQASGATS